MASRPHTVTRDPISRPPSTVSVKTTAASLSVKKIQVSTASKTCINIQQTEKQNQQNQQNLQPSKPHQHQRPNIPKSSGEFQMIPPSPALLANITNIAPSFQKSSSLLPDLKAAPHSTNMAIQQPHKVPNQPICPPPPTANPIYVPNKRFQQTMAPSVLSSDNQPPRKSVPRAPAEATRNENQGGRIAR